MLPVPRRDADNNRWNQLIHFLFVPAILFSLLVGLAYAAPLVELAPGLAPAAAALPAVLRE